MKFLLLFLITFSTIQGFTLSQKRYVETPVVKEIPDLQTILESSKLEKTQHIQSLGLSTKDQNEILAQIENSKKAIETLIKKGDLIDQGPLFNFVDSLLEVIKSKNSTIAPSTRVYIVRDLTANAFNTGDHVIFINLGLLYRFTNHEEIMYIMCHELGHDVLDHGMQAMVSSRSLFANDSISKEMRGRVQRRYGNVSAVNELMIPLLIAHQSQSRAHEYAADSLGFQYYSNLGLNLNSPITAFEVFKNIGHEKSTNWDRKNPFINHCQIDTTQIAGKFKGSSMGNFKAEKKPYEEELKSHPYENERQEALKKLINDSNPTEAKPSSNDWMFWTENEMINEAFRQQDLTQMSYLILHGNPSHMDTAYTKDLFAMSYMLLAHMKQARISGGWLGFASRDSDDQYNDMLEYLRRLTPEQTYGIAECLGKEMLEGNQKDYYNAFKAAYEMNHDMFKMHFQRIRDFDQESPMYRILLDHFNKYRLTLKF